MPRKWLQISTNDSSVKLDLKLEMWPVNALRLEWCYDTGNDKNVTDINAHTHIGVCQTYNIAFE